MTEEEKKLGLEKQPDPSEDYIKIIKELQEKSVSKEDYTKLREENRKLLETIVNGKSEAATAAPEKPIDVSALREDIFTKDNSNLEYITKALELRKELMDAGEADPFTPVGHNIVASEEDCTKAAKVADVLQECVDAAQGDSAIFTNELQRHLVDTIPVKRK